MRQEGMGCTGRKSTGRSSTIVRFHTWSLFRLDCNDTPQSRLGYLMQNKQKITCVTGVGAQSRRVNCRVFNNHPTKQPLWDSAARRTGSRDLQCIWFLVKKESIFFYYGISAGRNREYGLKQYFSVLLNTRLPLVKAAGKGSKLLSTKCQDYISSKSQPEHHKQSHIKSS